MSKNESPPSIPVNKRHDSSKNSLSRIKSKTSNVSNLLNQRLGLGDINELIYTPDILAENLPPMIRQRGKLPKITHKIYNQSVSTSKQAKQMRDLVSIHDLRLSRGTEAKNDLKSYLEQKQRNL
jgi:hypothetical protein